MCLVFSSAHPSFIVTPKDKIVGVGRRVTFRCEVTGNPPPAVFWSKDNNEVRILILSYQLLFIHFVLLINSWDIKEKSYGNIQRYVHQLQLIKLHHFKLDRFKSIWLFPGK